MYDPAIPAEQTVWGKTIPAYGTEAITYCLQQNRELLEQMDGILELEKSIWGAVSRGWSAAVGAAFFVAVRRLGQLLRAAANVLFRSAGSAARLEDDVLKKSHCSPGAIRLKKRLSKVWLHGNFALTLGSFREDISDLRPKVSTLFRWFSLMTDSIPS